MSDTNMARIPDTLSVDDIPEYVSTDGSWLDEGETAGASEFEMLINEVATFGFCPLEFVCVPQLALVQRARANSVGPD